MLNYMNLWQIWTIQQLPDLLYLLWVKDWLRVHGVLSFWWIRSPWSGSVRLSPYPTTVRQIIDHDHLLMCRKATPFRHIWCSSSTWEVGGSHDSSESRSGGRVSWSLQAVADQSTAACDSGQKECEGGGRPQSARNREITFGLLFHKMQCPRQIRNHCWMMTVDSRVSLIIEWIVPTHVLAAVIPLFTTLSSMLTSG